MEDLDKREKIARWRYAIIGSLLASPMQRGELSENLRMLSEREWTHPITGKIHYFSQRTMEEWYWRVRQRDTTPIDALRTLPRRDANQTRSLSAHLMDKIREIRESHPEWTAKLVHEELKEHARRNCPEEKVPSYSTVRRWMKANGLRKKRKAGSQVRSSDKEVRRYEVAANDELWHLDFHHGDAFIRRKDGSIARPKMMCVLDDRSRSVCHAQWYISETAETLINALSQAFMKRGLPRMILMDNGSQMVNAEVANGLIRLGIQQVTTQVNSPYQNGKQERFFRTMQLQLIPLLKAESELSLDLLNRVTATWIASEYEQSVNRETGETPHKRFLDGPSIARECPPPDRISVSFTRDVTRKVQQKTGTVTIETVRFEIPFAMRHIESLRLRYAQFDLSRAWIVDKRDGQPRTIIYPENTIANSSQIRRPLTETAETTTLPVSRPLLLQKYIDQSMQPGHSAAFLPMEGEE